VEVSQLVDAIQFSAFFFDLVLLFFVDFMDRFLDFIV
jgi:hypothetical protein